MTATQNIETFAKADYKYGFVTDIDSDTLKPGLNEDIIRFISAKKNEPQWLLDWRLSAYKQWVKMTEPKWPNVTYPPINYQDVIYYSAPKQSAKAKSLEEIDPELIKTFEKLGI